MTINRAHKGRRVEHRARRILEAAGFIVIRSAGSKGPIDLVGLTAGYARLIQCKSGRSRPGALEKEELKELSRRLGGHFSVEVWCFPDRAREPLIEVL